MSVTIDVDLEENQVRIRDLFDEDGECRLVEEDEGWRGFRKRGDRYYWVDTLWGEDWPNEIEVTVQAVEQVVSRWIEPVEGGW